ncbi:MAG: hypothetical protein AMK73_02960 [Planctomycetes bacterium SM23_32]|nr:MAG: hypothetical protein AMK73_02960 [Planctomycetes bacterium SM23_32]
MRELTEREEEILEHLWILIEEQHERADPGMLADAYELRSLKQLGLVELGDREAKLTREGRLEAQGCVRRHRLAERLLKDVLDSDDEEMHAAGCKLEHGLHRGLEERVCTMLGHPRVCPHGKPIPPGDCCRRMERQTGPLLTTVAELERHEPAVVAYLHSAEVADLRKLMAIGALPGTELVVRQRFPSFLVELGGSQFGIDEHMARQIYVRRSGGGRRGHGGPPWR